MVQWTQRLRKGVNALKKLLPFLPAALGALAAGLMYLAFARFSPIKPVNPLTTLSNSALLPGLILTFIGAKLWAAPRGLVKQDMRLIRPRANPLQPLIKGYNTPRAEEDSKEAEKPRFLRYLLPGAALLALAIVLAIYQVR